MDWELVVAVVCLFLSFLFSASETALTSLGRLEIQKIQENNAGLVSQLLHLWARDPGRILITILIGNNIVNIVASSVFTLWATHYFPTYVAIIMGAFTFFVIMFSEIIPKLIARNYSERLAPIVLKFLNLVGFVLFPVVWITNHITTLVVTVIGLPRRELRKPISEEELTQTIEMATKEGGIDREMGEVLSNYLEFPDILARDVMTPRTRMKAISVRWNLDEVLRFVAKDGHSRYPVIINSLDELVGVVLVKDLIGQIHRGGGSSWTRVVRRPFFINELAPLGTVLRDMRRLRTHLALIRDERGIVTGIVTFEDLIEEIVGEIHDEHDDIHDWDIDDSGGGKKLVNGEIPVLDFNARFNASLPLDLSYSTLNGYLLAKLGGQLPPVGTLIFDEEMTFRIHSVSDTGIATVEIIEHIKTNE